MNCSHCDTALYVADKYCSGCGGKIDNPIKILQCEDVDKEIKGIKEDMPSAELFTGVVTETLHYKREKKREGGLTEVGYWWLTVSDGVNQHQVSIRSENSLNDSIAKGQVVTLLRPEKDELIFRLANESHKSIVTNNDLASYLIWHTNKDSIQSPEKAISPTSVQYFTMIFAAMGLAGLVELVLFFVNDDFVNWVMAALLWVVLCAIFLKIDTSRYNAELKHYNFLENYLKRIRNIDLLQLNGHRFKRHKSDNDWVCNHCNQRNSDAGKHCISCGEITPLVGTVLHNKALESDVRLVEPKETKAQTNAAPEITEQAEAENVAGSVDKEVESTNEIATNVESQHFTVAERIDAEMRPLEVRFEDKFTQRFGLGFTKRGSIRGQVVVAQALDRNARSDVRAWEVEHIKETTVTTKTQYSVTTEKYSEVVGREKHRRSNLNGELILQTLDGEQLNVVPPQEVLSAVDVGDYIVVGRSSVILGGRAYNYQDFFYNINKDEVYRPNPIVNYNPKGMTKLCFWILGPFAGFEWYHLLQGNTNDVTTAAVLTSLLLLLLFRAFRAMQATDKAINSAIDKINETLPEFKKSREKWLSWIN